MGWSRRRRGKGGRRVLIERRLGVLSLALGLMSPLGSPLRARRHRSLTYANIFNLKTYAAVWCPESPRRLLLIRYERYAFS